jgi:hypothetical protein
MFFPFSCCRYFSSFQFSHSLIHPTDSLCRSPSQVSSARLPFIFIARHTSHFSTARRKNVNLSFASTECRVPCASRLTDEKKQKTTAVENSTLWKNLSLGLLHERASGGALPTEPSTEGCVPCRRTARRHPLEPRFCKFRLLFSSAFSHAAISLFQRWDGSSVVTPTAHNQHGPCT